MVKRTFLDTSVLLGGLLDIRPPDRHAQEVMSRISDRQFTSAVTAWHCILEFCSVSTRLPVEYRLTPAEACRLIEEAILPYCQVVDLPEDQRLPFLRSCAVGRVVGGRVYDHHISEVARAARVSVVLTGNARHFGGLTLHGISVLSAREWIEGPGRPPVSRT